MRSLLCFLIFLPALVMADYGGSSTYPDTDCPQKVFTLYIGGVAQTPTYDKHNTAMKNAFKASQRYPDMSVSVQGGELNCSTTWRQLSSSSRSSSSLASSSRSSSVPSAAATLTVSKTGQSGSDCKATKCLTIQRALDLAKAGDVIVVEAGTYIESSLTSTQPCYWFSAAASLCIRSSGTPSAPIVLSAKPGDVVVLDNQSARVGIFLDSHDYITIRGLKIVNSLKNGIANVSQAGNLVPDDAMLSKGVVVENNIIENVTTNESGDNIAAIGPWSSQDWIIRGNRLSGVPGGSGIRAYGVINALVERNTIESVREGVMWKDHFALDNSRTKVFESEIRQNDIAANEYGVLIQIRGSDTPEAGHNYVHHNVFRGLRDGEAAGLRMAMAGAYGLSGQLRFEHNTIDCSQNSQSVGMTVDSSEDVRIKANIFLSCGIAVEAIKYSDTNVAHITYSDYNLFVDAFATVMDRYSGSSIFYRELPDWQVATDAQTVSLAINSPDASSRLVSASTARLVNYVPQSGSPALVMMPGAVVGAISTGSTAGVGQ